MSNLKKHALLLAVMSATLVCAEPAFAVTDVVLNNSVALGNNTTALGNNDVAIGGDTNASGNGNVVINGSIPFSFGTTLNDDGTVAQSTEPPRV